MEDWYDDSFPEYRSAPPWVMEDMLAAEPDLPGPIAEQAPSAAVVASLARAAHERGEPIVVTGCGTSEQAAQAIAALICEALGPGAAAARQALDAVASPRAGGLCIAVSHEGETAATLAAVIAARQQGALAALITARAASRGARHVDAVLETPAADRSWCHTVGYVAPILAGGLIAAELGGAPFDAAATAWLIAALANHRVDVHPLAATERLVAAGAGADAITARELALKVAEGARMPSTALELENVLHGHLVAHDARSALVLVTTEPAGSVASRRAAQVVAAASRIGLPVAMIAASETADALAPDLVVPMQPAADVPDLLARLLGGAIGLQLLTIALARQRGVNPDLLRREEEPYREAARAGEKKTAEVFLDVAADA